MLYLLSILKTKNLVIALFLLGYASICVVPSGSMEFSCKVAGAKVVVVLGHTKCGAVKGACDHVKMGNLTTLLEKLKPAVDGETSVTSDRNANNSEFVEKVASLNVRITKKQILKNSPILKEMIEKGEIALAGGMYDVETGIVDFYDDEIVTQETISKKATVVQHL